MAGVIVADNDSLIRSILRAMLGDVGQDVLLAGDGEEAVRFASRMEASLVILDLNMPRMNGLMACQTIRALPGYAATPIVVLTALDQSRAGAAAQRAGATVVLHKPFQPATLLQLLSPYLGLDPSTQARLRRGAAQALQIAVNDPGGVRENIWGRSPSGRTAGPLDAGRDRLNVYR